MSNKRYFYILTFISVPILIFSQTKENIYTKLLNKGVVGREYRYDNPFKEEGYMKVYLVYLGNLNSKMDSVYKIIKSTTIVGRSKKAINRLYIFDYKNDCLGSYHFILRDELPIKIKKNILVFKKENHLDKENFYTISFNNGIPGIICPGCIDITDGSGRAFEPRRNPYPYDE